MVRLNDGAFTDTQEPLISLAGSASLTSFSDLTLTKPDSRRFRLNIIFETSTPFEEAALINKSLAVGDVRLDVIDLVGRCAAIDVDPETGERGPNYLKIMEEAFGHTALGIFARVTRGGTISLGDELAVLP